MKENIELNRDKQNDHAFVKNSHCDQPTSQLLSVKGSAYLVHLDIPCFM